MPTQHEDITCIYCGNKFASVAFDDLGPERGETYYCFLCGWSKHEQGETCDEGCDEEYDHKPNVHAIKIAKKLVPVFENLEWDDDLVDDFFMTGWIGHFSNVKRYDALIDILFSGPNASKKYK